MPTQGSTVGSPIREMGYPPPKRCYFFFKVIGHGVQSLYMIVQETSEGSWDREGLEQWKWWLVKGFVSPLACSHPLSLSCPYNSSCPSASESTSSVSSRSKSCMKTTIIRSQSHGFTTALLTANSPKLPEYSCISLVTRFLSSSSVLSQTRMTMV